MWSPHEVLHLPVLAKLNKERHMICRLRLCPCKLLSFSLKRKTRRQLSIIERYVPRPAV